MLRAFARPIWHRRHRIISGTKRAGALFLRGLRRLPIPERVRLVTADLFFLSIEHLILNTNLHHQWRRRRMGTERLHSLFKPKRTDDAPVAAMPTAPSDADFSALPDSAKRAGAIVNDATVDVVMPIYRDYDQTLNAIWRALQTTGETRFELIVINDYSPDPQLGAKLRELAQAKWFTLIENPQNLGFVQTVNKGMQIHGDRDVVLLNSDTEVFADWLDRLHRHAYSSNAVGTVTPLSNNAEICSYPFMVHDNNMPLEVDYATLDQLAAAINKGRNCELPTAVGFCMFIKRRCLRDVGVFDAETFGRGYGEENDFCLRAAKHSWKHLLAGDVFVRHIGGTSFSAEKKTLVKQGLKVLNARYPHYAAQVRDFIKADPVRSIRQHLDLARLKHAGRDFNMLMVNHSRGGGTERHVRELSAALAKESIGTYLLYPSDLESGGMMLSHYGVAHTPNAFFSLEYDREGFFEAMLELGISHIHVHHLIGFPHRMIDFLTELSSALDIKYDVTLHDYYTICPRINLVDADDFYNGEPDIETYERMMEYTPSNAEGMPVWQWRLHFARLLRSARRVFVPDLDVKERMLRYVPEAAYHVRPHEEQFSHAPLLTRPAPSQNEELQVAVIGALSTVKGSSVLAALAKDAAERGLPIHYTLIGYTNHAELNSAEFSNVTVTGEYREEEIESLLQKHNPHVVLIPSVWPETYCYTLSIALRYGIYPVVFDLGAQGRRVRELGYGSAVPLALAKDAPALNNFLVTLEFSDAAVKRPDDLAYAHYVRNYYELETPWAASAEKPVSVKEALAPAADASVSPSSSTQHSHAYAAGKTPVI
ncbi:MAG: glycosyltransferase [Rickettsiales bacterium]|nr:glycosyltransferase [Rickettsiales bacterium]